MAVYAIAAVVRFKRGRAGNVLQHFELVIVTGKDSPDTRAVAVERFRESFEKSRLGRTGWRMIRAPIVVHIDQEKAVNIVKWASKPEPLIVERKNHLRVVKE